MTKDNFDFRQRETKIERYREMGPSKNAHQASIYYDCRTKLWVFQVAQQYFGEDSTIVEIRFTLVRKLVAVVTCLKQTICTHQHSTAEHRLLKLLKSTWCLDRTVEISEKNGSTTSKYEQNRNIIKYQLN